MIEIQSINKKFGKLEVLKDITLSFNRGECIALIGPNGCGKTTLIKSILGMVIPDSGSIEFDGQAVLNTYTYRERIGYMPQIGKYPENMSIGQIFETIRSIRKFNGVAEEELMDVFGLPDFFDKRMRTLSGGTTQKVSACLAFLFRPDVLILDEPTAGLDPLSAEILKSKIIAERNNGKLILISSHMLSELDDMVTQVVFMQDGHIQFHLPVDELLLSTGDSKLSSSIANTMRKRKEEMKLQAFNRK